MTRINLVDPAILTDKHLLAEYKEITRPFNKMKKRLADNNPPTDIPEKYCLGKGHETFFFDKLGWLWHRYNSLYAELCIRGYNMDFSKFRDISRDFEKTFLKTEWWSHPTESWNPTPEEIYLNMARLAKRSNIEAVQQELKSDK